jgi:hypothetical protein
MLRQGAASKKRPTAAAGSQASACGRLNHQKRRSLAAEAGRAWRGPPYRATNSLGERLEALERGEELDVLRSGRTIGYSPSKSSTALRQAND